MFLFLLLILSEDELVAKMSKLEKEIEKKQAELHEINTELEKLKISDQKFKNRLSYNANSQNIKYEKPKTREIVLNGVNETEGFIIKKQIFKFFNTENKIVSSISFGEIKNGKKYPNTFEIEAFIDEEKVVFKKQKKEHGSYKSISLPTPMMITQINVMFSQKEANFPPIILHVFD